jgi:hypothetical protein
VMEVYRRGRVLHIYGLTRAEGCRWCRSRAQAMALLDDLRGAASSHEAQLEEQRRAAAEEAEQRRAQQEAEVGRLTPTEIIIIRIIRQDCCRP